MTKPSKPFSVDRHNILVYVHGTNGSGKSTLARMVAAAAGGITEYRPSHTMDKDDKGRPVKVGSTHTARGVYLLGKYDRACGGVDGIHPYAWVREELLLHAIFPHAPVFAEGLITPGVETCAAFAGLFDKAVFVVLEVDEATATKNVMARRARKGTAAPYDPANLYKKAESARHWGDRLERAGLEVRRLNFWQAYTQSLELLRLPKPSTEELLY